MLYHKVSRRGEAVFGLFYSCPAVDIWVRIIQPKDSGSVVVEFPINERQVLSRYLIDFAPTSALG